MKRIILILCLMSTLNLLYSQENPRKIDFKIGVGISLDGGDEPQLSFENELSYKLNNYFSTSLYFGLGNSLRSTDRMLVNTKYDFDNIEGLQRSYVDYATDYLHAGVNLFVSPFKNNKRNNFKIGLGLGVGVRKDFATQKIYVYNGKFYDYLATITGEVRRSSVAYNIVLEDEYWIHPRFSIGGKVFCAGLFNDNGGAIGAMIKLGISL